jgi:hypothetical protein
VSLALIDVCATLLAVSLVAVRAGTTVVTALGVGALGQRVTETVVMGTLVNIGTTHHTITGVALRTFTTSVRSLLVDTFG